MPILQRVHCPDDPRRLLEQRLFVPAVSKDVRGERGKPDGQPSECEGQRYLIPTTAGFPWSAMPLRGLGAIRP